MQSLTIMRQFLLALSLLLPFLSLAQETVEFKEYKYSELFQMIEREPSDTFRLENAYILYDSLAAAMNHQGTEDSLSAEQGIDSLHVYKQLSLSNVFFFPDEYQRGNLGLEVEGIVFHQRPSFSNVLAQFKGIHFKKGVGIRFSDDITQIIDRLDHTARGIRAGELTFDACVFEEDPGIVYPVGTEKTLGISIENSIFKKASNRVVSIGFPGFFILRNNTFLGEGYSYMWLRDMGILRIENNDFGQRFIELSLENNSRLFYQNNQHEEVTAFSLTENNSNVILDWKQFRKGVISPNGLNSADSRSVLRSSDNIQNAINSYVDSLRIANENAYRAEIKDLGQIVSLFRKQFDRQSANASFIALKDLETDRLEYLYRQDPNFKTFFKWRINQFLKVFSAYGTEPERAIIFSTYVILAFALIYLFFPNYWDSHGKNRIVDRYTFFLKYMQRDAGIQEVYLEEKKAELLAYDEYKNLIESSGKNVPKFFQVTALPLYKWAISSTKITASLLSKIDIVKGTWSELPQSKRLLKSILLTGVFLIALLYDIFIKMLNALMLSINTFTTLGFGEIPIKGLPRYLAIIQGFIGWFMLTIFSVSLISQLLN